jgi:uncharacterized protein (DUF2267 family)
MTMPLEYARADEEFEIFMKAFMDISMLPTHHRAYAVVRGVLHTFRNHLTIDDALRFAEFLPAILRAIFVEDWHPQTVPPPFPDRAALTAEAHAMRRDHNFVGETSISEVAQALRKTTDATRFELVLKKLPAEAQAFWQV